MLQLPRHELLVPSRSEPVAPPRRVETVLTLKKHSPFIIYRIPITEYQRMQASFVKFFDLPAELRELVLAALLTKDGSIPLAYHHRVDPRDHIPLSVLLTSRRMRNEATAAFYRYNTFRLDVKDCFDFYQEVLEPRPFRAHIESRQRRQIRRLTVVLYREAITPQVEHPALQTIQDMIAEGELIFLNVEFRKASPRLGVHDAYVATPAPWLWKLLQHPKLVQGRVEINRFSHAKFWCPFHERGAEEGMFCSAHQEGAAVRDGLRETIPVDWQRMADEFPHLRASHGSQAGGHEGVSMIGGDPRPMFQIYEERLKRRDFWQIVG